MDMIGVVDVLELVNHQAANTKIAKQGPPLVGHDGNRVDTASFRYSSLEQTVAVGVDKQSFALHASHLPQPRRPGRRLQKHSFSKYFQIPVAAAEARGCDRPQSGRRFRNRWRSCGPIAAFGSGYTGPAPVAAAEARGCDRPRSGRRFRNRWRSCGPIAACGSGYTAPLPVTAAEARGCDRPRSGRRFQNRWRSCGPIAACGSGYTASVPVAAAKARGCERPRSGRRF